MSWFTNQLSGILNPDLVFPFGRGTENSLLDNYVRDAFAGLVQTELVSTLKSSVAGARLANYKLSLQNAKKTDEGWISLSWDLSKTIGLALEEFAKLEDSFKKIKYDDLYLLGNEKRLIQIIDDHIVKPIQMLVDSKVSAEREGFASKMHLLKLKHQRINELSKILQTQQEKADVEASINIQKGIKQSTSF